MFIYFCAAFSVHPWASNRATKKKEKEQKKNENHIEWEDERDLELCSLCHRKAWTFVLWSFAIMYFKLVIPGITLTVYDENI